MSSQWLYDSAERGYCQSEALYSVDGGGAEGGASVKKKTEKGTVSLYQKVSLCLCVEHCILFRYTFMYMYMYMSFIQYVHVHVIVYTMYACPSLMHTCIYSVRLF